MIVDSALLRQLRSLASSEPHAPALIFRDTALTRADLEAASDTLARELARTLTDQDRLIAISLPRDVGAVVAAIAIWKTGRAWVVVDPSYPVERQAVLIQGSGANVVLRNAGPLRRNEPSISFAASTTAIYAERTNYSGPQHDLPPDLAYVLYTSGSTGLPKGCMVTHENLIQSLRAATGVLDVSPSDVWSCVHSLSFDFSLWEIFGSLFTGGKCVLIDRRSAMDPALLINTLAAHGVTVLSQVPSAFGNTQKALESFGGRLDVRYVVFGGERLNQNLLEAALASPISPKARLINMYGITEMTIHSTFIELGEGSERLFWPPGTGSPIGRPLGATEIRIVNDIEHPVSPGEVGEMLLSGPTVCAGYIGSPTETAERFFDAAGSSPGSTQRWYRSGDLARLGADGILRFVGRRDQQVKIRGHRVELHEVEHWLMRHPAIETCVCLVALRRQEPVLVAFYTSESELMTSDLQSHVATKLPDFMIPSFFFLTTSIPLTENGKSDLDTLSHQLPRGLELPVDASPPAQL